MNKEIHFDPNMTAAAIRHHRDLQWDFKHTDAIYLNNDVHMFKEDITVCVVFGSFCHRNR